jgi:hypothetical protein
VAKICDSTFTAGQCPVSYTISFTGYTQRYNSATGAIVSTSSTRTLTFTRLGPITDTSYRTENTLYPNGGYNRPGEGTSAVYLRVRSAQPEINFNLASISGSIRDDRLRYISLSISIARIDGQLDSCGNPQINCRCDTTDETIACAGQTGGICCIEKVKIANWCKSLGA